ncbi:MAG: hypothetical protein HW412_2665, partial [Bacteroidetes bacterium]|nr:hypothetical protein [Bacteroidota bacterium]
GYFYPSNEPFQLSHVFPSHKLVLANNLDQGSNRDGIAGFIVQSLAFLFGTKLQFWDWHLEGRIPVRIDNIDFSQLPKSLNIFFHKAIHTWNQYDPTEKRRILSILFVHSVAGAIEWDWQQFMLEYMVTDACYKMIAENKKDRKTKNRLKKPFEVLCDRFGLIEDSARFRHFKALRDKLFHETLWHGGHVFTYRSSESTYAPIFLRRFNNRVITGILCGKCSYVGSRWTSLSPASFSLD